MKNKNYQQIARQILESKDFEPLTIQLTPKHMKRIQGVAQALDLTTGEAATFIMYSYINDMELASRIAINKAMPPN